MKKVNQRLSTILMLYGFLTWCSFMSSANAMPANDSLLKIAQPNGTIVEAKKRGDEHGGWIETKSGYTIAKSVNGYWYYVNQYNQTSPVLSDTKAALPPPKGTAQHKSPISITTQSEAFDQSRLRKGKLSPKVLMILVDHDAWHGTYRTASTWSQKIVNSTPDAKTIADYYAKASYGTINITPATESYGVANDGVIGWLRLTSDVPLDRSLGDGEKVELIKAAIAAADDYVDYADYDTNNDGKITGNELAIIIVMAGYEESTVGVNEPNATRVWGEAFTDNYDSWYTAEGIKANYTEGLVEVCEYVLDYLDEKGYTGPHEVCHKELQIIDKEIAVFDPLIIGEIHQTEVGDKPAPLGMFAHELGHSIFYLPDMYDRNDPVGDIGGYSLMAYGGWGKDYRTDTYNGETPVLPDAWSQYKLNWVTTTIVDPVEAAGRNNIPSVKPKVGIAHIGKRTANSLTLDCTNKEEYFLLQYRADVGYDRGLNKWFADSLGYQYAFTPGIAIFHVDESISHNMGTPRLVDLEEANNIEVGAFWGWQYRDHLWSQGKADQFNSLTIPSSNSNDGLESGVSVAMLDQFAQLFSSSTNRQLAAPTLIGVNIDIDSQCDRLQIGGHNPI